MKIIIFDEHPVISESLIKFISEKKETKEIQAETNLTKLLTSIKKCSSDLIIMDIPSEKYGGISALTKIRKLNNTIKIIVYSHSECKNIENWVLKYGANEFISKKIPLSNLWQVVNTTSSKDYLSNQYEKFPNLTIKEKVIIELVAKGFSSYEIANLTNKSINTINNQKKHLVTKFGCSNSLGLVIMLYKLRVIV